VLVVRKDKKDITTQSNRDSADMRPKEISWGRNVGRPCYKSEREEMVEKYFQSSKFEEFFEFKKGKHAEGDLPWADSVSPRST